MPLKRFGSGTSKTVSSNLHKFHKVMNGRLELLKQRTMKKRSKTKLLWGCYNISGMRQNRLSDVNSYGEQILLRLFYVNTIQTL